MAITSKAALEKHRSSGMTASELGAFGARFGMHAVELPGGTELYKYSGDYPFRADRRVWSPWWSARQGTKHDLGAGKSISWTGLGSHLTKAMHGNYSDVKVARTRSAVKHEWNSMRNIFIARLIAPAWAWVGQCKGQRVSDTDPNYSNLYLIGGDYQYYIPDLQQHDLMILSAHCGDDEGRI